VQWHHQTTNSIKVELATTVHLQITKLLVQVSITIDLQRRQISLTTAEVIAKLRRIDWFITKVIVAEHLRTNCSIATIKAAIALCFRQINCFVAKVAAAVVDHLRIES